MPSSIGVLSPLETILYVLNPLKNTCLPNFAPHQCFQSSLAVCPVLNPALPTAWHLLHNSWPRDLKYLASAASLGEERPL